MVPSRSVLAPLGVVLLLRVGAGCTSFGAAGEDAGPPVAADGARPFPEPLPPPSADGAAPPLADAGPVGPPPEPTLCATEWSADFEGAGSFMAPPWMPFTSPAQSVVVTEREATSNGRGVVVSRTIAATTRNAFTVRERAMSIPPKGTTRVALEIGDVEANAEAKHVLAQLTGLPFAQPAVKWDEGKLEVWLGDTLVVSKAVDAGKRHEVVLTIDLLRKLFVGSVAGSASTVPLPIADASIPVDGGSVLGRVQIGLFFPTVQAPAMPPTRVRYDDVKVEHCP